MGKANYINKEELQTEIVNWCKKRDEAMANGAKYYVISDKIAKAILLICKGTVSRQNFNQYSYVDEMMQDAILSCINSMRSYDVNHPKQNPFGYFSRVAYWACVERINIEKAHAEAIEELLLDENNQTYSIMSGDVKEVSMCEVRQFLLFN